MDRVSRAATARLAFSTPRPAFRPNHSILGGKIKHGGFPFVALVLCDPWDCPPMQNRYPVRYNLLKHEGVLNLA